MSYVETVALGSFGVEVRGIDPAIEITADVAGSLCGLLARHQLLLFRMSGLSPNAQIAFTRVFGPLEDGLTARPADHKVSGNPDILHLSNAGGSATRDYGFGWHSDGLAYARTPHGATVLQCIACPPGVGATLFADQYAACERMDEALRRRLEGLYWRLPPIPFSEVPRGGGLAHPILRNHPLTGRQFVFCSPAAEMIMEWAPQDSKCILDALRAHQLHPDGLYRHVWMPGDLIVWENCALLHTREDAVDYIADGARIMYRTATRGSFDATPCAPP